IHSDNGTCMVTPHEGDEARLYIQLSDQDVIDPAIGRVDQNRTLSPEKLLAVGKKMLYTYTLESRHGFDWWAIYTSAYHPSLGHVANVMMGLAGQRVAPKFSTHERVFIAGDACHTHSPKAVSQGMNASVSDTHNLAWKLAHVLRGWADLFMLKTYELERRQYAQELINFDKKLSALFSGKPRKEAFQGGVTHEEFLSAFQAYEGFTSGIGVHYAESALVNSKHQPCAQGLVVGERMLPQEFIRAADSRPCEIQDLLLSDGRFKVLLFAGRADGPEQPAKIHAMAGELDKPTSFLKRYLAKGKGVEGMFDVITIIARAQGNGNVFALPDVFRSHWSKILMDNMDVTRSKGGHAYERFGIGLDELALIIVRPDGYIGMVAPQSCERLLVIDI
ncbi:thioredoxin-like protein, partial [Coniophora puteana RWD-64-598 SS2]